MRDEPNQRDLNRVERALGVSTHILDRSDLLYRDGPRSAIIEFEALVTDEIVVYVDSIRGWAPPFDSEPLTLSEREEILRVLGAISGYAGQCLKRV